LPDTEHANKLCEIYHDYNRVVKKFFKLESILRQVSSVVIKLILIDIDGTLVGENGVPESAWHALTTARRRSIHLGLCTGRIGCGIALEHARRVSLDGLHVFHSGAVITKPDAPAAYISDLPRDAYDALVQIARREGATLEVYLENTYHLEVETELTRVHSQHLEMVPIVSDLATLEGHIVRAQWVVHESEWPHLLELTQRLPGIEISPATAPWSPGTIFASVTRRGTSKADALAWIAKHLDLMIAEVSMIGDGENDLGAIQAAGLGIAMGNSPAIVKNAADHVVNDVDSDGLAQAIDFAMAQA
jgi:Cof subfamily protein (haloacid dehalogenase superfamily)